MSSTACLSDFTKLRTILSKAKNIVVLTGAGTSAESGIPTFRGSGGFWRTYQSQDLATYSAFKRSPSLVWEFYHYRRELVLTKQPNKAHVAIAEAECQLKKVGRKLTVVTQNIDGLHQRAGSENVIELHGSLYKTCCLKCSDISFNFDSPICPALNGLGAPDGESSNIPEEQLPRCKKSSCQGLLRPHIVWFGENLHEEVLLATDNVLQECEACLLIGTSSVVYPAAMYAPSLAARNIPVAEFNLEPNPASHYFQFYFQGPCTETVPEALKGITGSNNHLCMFLQTRKCNELSKRKFSTCLMKWVQEHKETTHMSESKTAENDTAELGKTEKEIKKANLKQKFKLFIKDYGSTVIVVHFGNCLIILGFIYSALSCGLDLTWLLTEFGFGEKAEALKKGGTFVLSYAITKVLAPVRFAITFTATPIIVKRLRKIGFLKPGKK